ncbi:YD repeat-containing protein [Tibeticola sediminis]|uniref:YD repeat-containing protein n=1 Tax=Tibeticola sediminis TaxID=1917811 RepID=A0A3N4UY96_9BURK|nr:hypothetical protein [Tibeticola sediminis]RPE72539.1 YD repeat-containing protein [Tibeticola sediminis]
MATRYPAYRMQDGLTPLSADYFNFVFADIDTRIAELEARRADLQGVIDDLTRFGLQRIDALIGPSMQAVDDMIADLGARRDALVAALAGVGEVVTQTQLQAAITAEQVARDEAIATATARPYTVTYSHDGELRVSGMSETLPSGTRTTTYSYDGAGRLTQAASVLGGRTRTTSYHYDSTGALASYTVMES